MKGSGSRPECVLLNVSFGRMATVTLREVSFVSLRMHMVLQCR